MPECNHSQKKGNFCDECAQPLKEICYKCGKMEKIGINYCETETFFLNEAKEEKYYFLDSKLDFWMSINIVIDSIFITITLIMGSVLYVLGYEQIGTIMCKGAGWWFLISLFAVPMLTETKKPKWEILFSKKFPQYADVINLNSK